MLLTAALQILLLQFALPVVDRITEESGFLVDSLDKEIWKNEMKWTIKTRDNISSSSYCTVLSVLRIFCQGLYQTCNVLYQPRALYPANRTSYHVTGHYVRHTHERGIDCKKPTYTRLMTVERILSAAYLVTTRQVQLTQSFRNYMNTNTVKMVEHLHYN